MKDFDDFDILLIRQCKRNKPSIRSLRRIVGMRCALNLEYVTKGDVVHFLMQIVLKFNLIRDWQEFLVFDMNPKKWWRDDVPKDHIDNLLEQLISKVSLTEVKIFPKWRSPARFRKQYPEEP